MAVFFCYRSSALVCSIILAVTLGKGLSASDHPSLCDKFSDRRCAHDSEDNCDIDKVTQLIEQGVEVDCRYQGHGYTFLMETLRCCSDEVVANLTKLLLEHNASVTKHSGPVGGRTALLEAVFYGHMKSAELILEHGGRVDDPDANGETVLMKAAMENYSKAVKWLLKAGADPFARDAAGLTARDHACAAGRMGLCRSLPKISSAEQWRRLSTSRPFWMVFASSALIAIVTYCWPVSSPPPPLGEAAPFSRESVLAEQAEGRYSRGAVLLAVRASYTSASTTGALKFRVLDVYATVVLPMFVMPYVQPMMFLPVFLAMCAPNLLARRISSCGTVNLSNLLVSVPRSLLIIQQWSGKDALVCVYGFIRVMVVVGLLFNLPPNPHGIEASSLLVMNWANEICPVPTGPCLRVPPVAGMWVSLLLVILFALALYCWSVLRLAVLSLRVGGGSFQPLAPNSAQVQDLAARIESLCCSRTDQDLRQDIGKLQGSVKRVAPLKSCTCCPPGGVYFTVAFVAVDLILDAITVYNLLMNEDVDFAGIILGTSTFSTVRELRSGSFRSLPSEVIESVRTGKWSTRLLDVLDSERGTEAVISLMVNSYAFVYMAKTPAKFLTSLLSLSTSTLSCASYVHEHFDLEGAMGEDH